MGAHPSKMWLKDGAFLEQQFIAIWNVNEPIQNFAGVKRH